jgi:hypothetical protein
VESLCKLSNILGCHEMLGNSCVVEQLAGSKEEPVSWSSFVGQSVGWFVTSFVSLSVSSQ